MKKMDVINHFGGVQRTAEALGRHRASVYGWADVVSLPLAMAIEKVTQGAVRVNIQDYLDLHAKEAAALAKGMRNLPPVVKPAYRPRKKVAKKAA